jgi:nicotinate-nucleotide adenylyltransferase
MNIGLFGGTFDPIHVGHIALAQAAREQFHLGCVLFVPTNVPPHKQQPAAPYFHRYAMVVLATMQEEAFLPSLLEAPEMNPSPAHGGRRNDHHGGESANYSIDTIRQVKAGMNKGDRLFFLIGVDAFQDIAKWYECEALFRECEFIVASRPGYSLADVASSLPEKLRPSPAVTKPFGKRPATGELILPGATVHLLGDVHQAVSATAVRQAIAAYLVTPA